MEKPRYLLKFLNVPMDTSFHNSTNNLLEIYLFSEEKSNCFCLEITQICREMLMISGMSSDLFLFRLRKHLWDAFRLFYGPFGAPRGHPYGPFGAPPGAPRDIDRITIISQTTYFRGLSPHKGEAAKPPGALLVKE